MLLVLSDGEGGGRRHFYTLGVGIHWYNIYGGTCSNMHISSLKLNVLGFPGGTVVKNLPVSAEDTGLSPGPGRSHILWSN